MKKNTPAKPQQPSPFAEMVDAAAQSENWGLWAVKFITSGAGAVGLTALFHTVAFGFVIWAVWTLWGAFGSNPMKHYARKLFHLRAYLAARKEAQAAAAHRATLGPDELARHDVTDKVETNWAELMTATGLRHVWNEQRPVMRSKHQQAVTIDQHGRNMLAFDTVERTMDPQLLGVQDTANGVRISLAPLGERGQTVAHVIAAQDLFAGFFGHQALSVSVAPDPQRPHGVANVDVQLFDSLAATANAGFANWFEDADQQSTSPEGWFEK